MLLYSPYNCDMCEYVHWVHTVQFTQAPKILLCWWETMQVTLVVLTGQDWLLLAIQLPQCGFPIVKKQESHRAHHRATHLSHYRKPFYAVTKKIIRCQPSAIRSQPVRPGTKTEYFFSVTSIAAVRPNIYYLMTTLEGVAASVYRLWIHLPY